MANVKKRTKDVVYEQILSNEFREAKDDTEATETVKNRAHYVEKILEYMSEEELTRFEFFVRSHLSRSKVKAIMQEEVGSQHVITDEMAIVVGGVAKLYMGELCDTAVDVMKGIENDPENDTPIDGLQPEHIMEGVRRMQREGKMTAPFESCPFQPQTLFRHASLEDELLHG